jgi:hypothetical protein
MRSLAGLPFVLVLAATAVSRAQSASAIDQDLKRAIEAYAVAIAKAKTDLLSKFDKAIDDVRKSKTVSNDNKPQAIEDLKRERERFDDDGTFPTAPGLKTAVAQYEKATEAAVAKLDPVFNKAIGTYTKQGKDAKAAAVLKLRNEIVVGPGHELVGTWTLATGKDELGLTERWIIRKTGGHWSVEQPCLNDSGETAGSAVGKSCEYSNGELRYTQHFEKNPAPGKWGSGSKVRLRREGPDSERLKLEWTLNQFSGEFFLVRAK